MPGGWNAEIRIPASHLLGTNTTLPAINPVDFSLGLHDDDDGGDWDSYLIWAGSSTNNQAEAILYMKTALAPTPLPTNTPTATSTSTSTPTLTPTPHCHNDAYSNRDCHRNAHFDGNDFANSNRHFDSYFNSNYHAHGDAGRAFPLLPLMLRQ